MVSHRKLVKHSNGANHKQAMASWCEYARNSKRGMSIESVMFGMQKWRIKDNRHYLRIVIENILPCANKTLVYEGTVKIKSLQIKKIFRNIKHYYCKT